MRLANSYFPGCQGPLCRRLGRVAVVLTMAPVGLPGPSCVASSKVLMVDFAAGAAISGSLGGIPCNDASRGLSPTQDETLVADSILTIPQGMVNLWSLVANPKLRLQANGSLLEADLVCLHHRQRLS